MNSAFIAIVEQAARSASMPRQGGGVSSSAASLRRFVALHRKEVRQMLRDRSNLAVGMLLPVVLILLFGYGLSFDVNNVPMAVVMEDSSPRPRDVLAGCRVRAYLAPVWVDRWRGRTADARRRSRRHRARAGRFLAAAGGRRRPDSADPATASTPIRASAVEGYVGGAIMAAWPATAADRAGATGRGAGVDDRAAHCGSTRRAPAPGTWCRA